MTALDSLQEALGIAFDDPSHLQQALIHRSYLNENDSAHLPSNERLEFLGDALLGFVIAQHLYSNYPHFSEGNLTNLRSSLVRQDTLARIARSLNLGDYLYLGRGEDDSGGRKRPRNLACTLEAVIGAVLTDRGYEQAKDFVLHILGKELDQPPDEKLRKDPKSKLQEFVQAKGQPVPKYKIIDVSGPDHERAFTVEALVGEISLGQGSGCSKRAAEQEAARNALQKLEGENLV